MGLIERIPGTRARINFRHESVQRIKEGSESQNSQTTLPELLSPDDTRHFNLFGSIDEIKVNGLIEQIESARYKEPQKKLFLKIKSDGGNVMQTYALISTLEANNVGTIAQSAKSSGALLVVSGAIGRRYVVAGTPIMIHDLSHADGVKGRLCDMEEGITSLVDMRNQLKTIYERRTKLTKKQIDTIFSSKRDIYFSDKEALKYGLVDHILGECNIFNFSESESNFQNVLAETDKKPLSPTRLFNLKK